MYPCEKVKKFRPHLWMVSISLIQLSATEKASHWIILPVEQMRPREGNYLPMWWDQYEAAWASATIHLCSLLRECMFYFKKRADSLSMVLNQWKDRVHIFARVYWVPVVFQARSKGQNNIFSLPQRNWKPSVSKFDLLVNCNTEHLKTNKQKQTNLGPCFLFLFFSS